MSSPFSQAMTLACKPSFRPNKACGPRPVKEMSCSDRALVFALRTAYTFLRSAEGAGWVWDHRNVAVVEVVMTGIVALTVVSALAGIGLLILLHRPSGTSPPGWRSGHDRELTSMLDRATVELLADRLRAGPLLVPVRVGHRLLGPFLVVDTGTTCLRLQLYNDTPRPTAPSGGRQGVARLRAITYTDGQGWRFVFDGPRGPQRYLGWLVEAFEPKGHAV